MPLLHAVVARRCCTPLLQTDGANCWRKLIVKTVVASYWRKFLVQTDGARCWNTL
jgi:hypothetical protein